MNKKTLEYGKLAGCLLSGGLAVNDFLPVCDVMAGTGTQTLISMVAGLDVDAHREKNCGVFPCVRTRVASIIANGQGRFMNNYDVENAGYLDQNDDFHCRRYTDAWQYQWTVTGHGGAGSCPHFGGIPREYLWHAPSTAGEYFAVTTTFPGTVPNDWVAMLLWAGAMTAGSLGTKLTLDRLDEMGDEKRRSKK